MICYIKKAFTLNLYDIHQKMNKLELKFDKECEKKQEFEKRIIEWFIKNYFNKTLF